MSNVEQALTSQAKSEVESQALQVAKSKGYLPTLDGWRAVAILGVIFEHDRLYTLGTLSFRWLHDHGRSGVDLFFAISGLLICGRLLEEEQVFGRISLRKFYIRRAFRILPPALVYLAVIGILSATGVLHIGLQEWFGSVFFFRNYTSLLGAAGPDSYFTGHFWSLAVEEHFYLILPAVLVLTQRRWRLPVLVGLTLFIEYHRMRQLEFRPWDHILFHTDIRLDGLIVPAIYAVLIDSGRIRERARKWLRFWPLLLISAIVLITNWEGVAWESTLVALLLPLTILGTVLNPTGFAALVLELAPIRYLGRISYSVYLWQQLFFISHSYTAHGYPLGILERTPLRFVATAAVAIASYHFLERPLIRLGHKLAPPATPGRQDALDVAPHPLEGQRESPTLKAK